MCVGTGRARGSAHASTKRAATTPAGTPFLCSCSACCWMNPTVSPQGVEDREDTVTQERSALSQRQQVMSAFLLWCGRLLATTSCGFLVGGRCWRSVRRACSRRRLLCSDGKRCVCLPPCFFVLHVVGAHRCHGLPMLSCRRWKTVKQNWKPSAQHFSSGKRYAGPTMSCCPHFASLCRGALSSERGSCHKLLIPVRLL